MTVYPEDMNHPVERTQREILRRLSALERSDRLIASSIGAGGMRVKDGGKIEILDGSGNVALTLSATQLVLAGLLSVTGTLDVDGNLNVSGPTTLDGNLDVVSGGTVTVDGGSFIVKDGAGATVLTLATSEMTLSGILKMLADANIETYDVDGDLRAELGSNLFFRNKTTGEVVQSLGLLSTGEFGLLVEEPDGVGDLVILHPGVFLSTHDNGVSAIRVSGNEIILRYNTGDVAVDLDLDLTISGPGTRGVVLRVNELDGLRVAVDTDADGIQSGQVTAGAADSAGTGFRTLRIPN